MLGVEAIPAGVILPDVRGALDPDQPADGDDVRTLIEKTRCLAGEGPIAVEEEVRRREPLEMPDHRVKDVARPWRIRYDGISATEVAQRQRVDVSLDVVGVDALKTTRLKLADQPPLARTGLRERPDAGQMPIKPPHRLGIDRLVGILRDALEVAALTYFRLLRSRSRATRELSPCRLDAPRAGYRTSQCGFSGPHEFAHAIFQSACAGGRP